MENKSGYNVTYEVSYSRSGSMYKKIYEYNALKMYLDEYTQDGQIYGEPIVHRITREELSVAFIMNE